MKIVPPIALFLLVTSCQSIDRAGDYEYCYQELELLKGNSSYRVDFDFNLSGQDQIKDLQNQTGLSLCKGITNLNGLFQTENSKIETMLTTDWYCVDSANLLGNGPLPCSMIRSKRILINSSNKILVDEELIQFDSLTEVISTLSKNFFWDNSYKLVAYEIKWDDKTERKKKLKAFEAVVNGYLHAANEISMNQYGKSLCELENSRLEELKKKFRFTCLIRNKLPLPLPLPERNYEIVVDTLETELEISD